MPSPGAITDLLRHLDRDDADAEDRLWRAMYDELHALAHRELRRRQAGSTLNTTALVHECFLKLRGAEPIDWQNRVHFYRGARQAMRQLVVDFARRSTRDKRGGGVPHLALDDAERLFQTREQAEELLRFDDALTRYGQQGPTAGRARQAVEYVYFVGLTHREAGALLGVAAKTVQRDVEHFKAWYARHYGRS